jgi:hypothetical protein
MPPKDLVIKIDKVTMDAFFFLLLIKSWTLPCETEILGEPVVLTTIQSH